MKTKFILSTAMLLMVSIVFAQVPYPHISSSNGSAERGAKFGVNGIANDFLEITNSTQDNGKYIPAIWAHQQSDNRYALMIFGTTNSSRDNGSVPLMVFRSELRNSLALNAPSGSTFPWGASGSTVINRPLFSWQNGGAIKMLMSANGYLGINATPTARLHTNGTVRFQNIPTTSSNTYVLTTDSSGNVKRQLSSTFGGGGIANNCNTLNYLTKKGYSGLTCSQIIDNGFQVGIGMNPFYKLDVSGTIRCTNITTFSDERYKKNISNVDNALELILKLNGKSYNWNKDLGAKKNMDFNDKVQYGLIAQDVEKVIPALSLKDSEDNYSINYIGIIPILIEAIKEQQNQIVALQDQINNDFQKRNADLINLKNTKIINVSPNPSSNTIEVSLNIEDTVKDAKLVTYDLNGKVMSSLNINDRNYNIKKSLHKDNFGSGTFIVSLMVNGKSLDSKKIIFK